MQLSEETSLDSIHISMSAISNVMKTLDDGNDKEALSRAHHTLSLKFEQMSASEKIKKELIVSKSLKKEKMTKTATRKPKVAISKGLVKSNKCKRCGSTHCDWGGSPCWLWDA